MSKTLTPTIAAYIDASNARQADVLTACFTAEAVVVDERRSYRGSDEIRQWFTEALATRGLASRMDDAYSAELADLPAREPQTVSQ